MRSRCFFSTFVNLKTPVMKKFLITIVLSLSLVAKSIADEGMWLPLLLGQQVYTEMVKKGLKLTKDQLYNINKASLKFAPFPAKSWPKSP